MDVKDAIEKRRAYRALEETEISDEIVKDLASCASLSASCFNNQPWRFVFAYDKEILEKLFEGLPEGNRWAKSASMIAAVFSKEEDDCNIKGRHYHLFDVGMATAQMILRATELGLVAHPIAGYDPEKVSETLKISKEYQIITLVIFGIHSTEIPDYLSENQAKSEKERPTRKGLSDFAYKDEYGRAL
jgi:nitroreductase